MLGRSAACPDLVFEIVHDALKRAAVAGRAGVCVVRRRNERWLQWLARLCNAGQAMGDGGNGASGALIVCVRLWGRRRGLAENGGGGEEEGRDDHAMAAKRGHEEARARGIGFAAISTNRRHDR